MHLALLAVAVLVAFAGCGEKDEPEPATPVPPTTSAQPGPGGGGGGAREPAAADDPRFSAGEREVLRSVRTYISALDAFDGSEACSVLAPGVLGDIRLPRERGSCAASLDASIGYRDPRGLPQFAGVKLDEIRSIRLQDEEARVTAALITDFADRPEPSVEDDLIYLERTRGDWLIAQPSAALYRAVGAEPGPRSIAPPA